MTPLDRLLTAVNDLTRPRTHSEGLTPDMAPINATTGRPIHGAVVRHVASLLTQLGECVEPSSEIRLDQGHPVPGSRPNASIEALDALGDIERELVRLLLYVGGKDRGDVTSNLHGMVGMFPGLTAEAQKTISQCASRWASRAWSVTGWEDPPFKPENTCPLCAKHRSLRIRVVSASEAHASCVRCGESWTPETIGLLAEHIRWENDEDGIEGEERELVVLQRPCNCAWTQDVCVWCSPLEESA